jgi:hypothetical protein
MINPLRFRALYVELESDAIRAANTYAILMPAIYSTQAVTHSLISQCEINARNSSQSSLTYTLMWHKNCMHDIPV